MTTEASPAPPQINRPNNNSLSFKHLFNNFFLLHDFFHKLTKSKAKNSDQFDLQIDIYNGMKNAVKTGGKLSVILTFGSLTWYCLKGNSIKLRFFYGFLFMYWWNHIYTLGTYTGVLFRLPSIYKITARYYENHPVERNLLTELDQFMNKQTEYEDTQVVLGDIFEKSEGEKSYVSNEFYVKNKEKYLPQQLMLKYEKNEKKLAYLDSFFTRYAYYNFTRWWFRVKTFLTFSSDGS